MRSFISRNGFFSGVAAIALLTTVSGCPTQDDEPNDPTIKIGETPFLPPTYTEQQCLDLVSTFPGWANVAPMPEYDAKGRPTLFYAVIPITAASQLDDLAYVGIEVQPEPIFTKDDPASTSQPGIVTKSTCGKYEIHWALVPGPIFNAIKTATLQEGETLVDAIVVQPVPDVFADASITYQGAHPVSYDVLTEAGYLYMGVNAPPPDTETQSSGLSLGGFVRAVTGAVDSVKKKVVRTVASLTHVIPNLIQRGIGWIDCRIQGCVNLRVNLDIRNTDTDFGGRIGPLGGSDESTTMVRAWGRGQGNQMQLPGVRIAAVQQLVSVGGYGINMRFEGTTNSSSSAGMEVRKGKPTRICMPMENYAATLNDYFTRTEICGLEAGGANRPRNVFQTDSTMSLEVQNKYVNLLAQFTDSRAYLQDVAGYAPRKLSALVGPVANLIGKLSNGRAMTPCLDFPNVALAALNGALVGIAGAAPSVAVPEAGPVLATAIALAQVALEVDMWLPDAGGLESRGIPTHEYGHFAMCSLLYDEDWTAMVKIPSLIIQRIGNGTYQDATDQVGYIMEGWADFFTGQVVSGGNYFGFVRSQLYPSGGQSLVQYCEGIKDDCWDWNYVEDLDATPNVDGSGDLGFNNQVRRIATTLFDAFDGQATQGDCPGDGDFWTAGSGKQAGRVVPSATHSGNGKDEVIALPGPALRTFIHNWAHASWLPVAWAVNEEQFFGALNATIRATQNPQQPGRTYSWCDACELFSQHDGLSCGTVGFGMSGGTCTSAGAAVASTMTMAQMVNVCGASPTLPGFIGRPPAATEPSSACTFTGCPTRSILVGTIGDAGASCVACGPHQVSTGVRFCTEFQCAQASTSATTCVDCAADQIVGGTDGNTCVTCPAFQVPSTDRTACVPCGAHQVAMGGACVTCPANQVVTADGTCQVCPDGRMPVSNNPSTGNHAPPVADRCIPTAECTCNNGSVCRRVSPEGVCVNVIG